MSATVAEILIDTLYQLGVRQIFGVVGDALNPLTDAIRRDKRIAWIGVRHEEGAALASFNNAAVGTSLGQANGIQALDRERQVVVAVGDGGFTMLLGEFMTSVEHGLPVKVVVFNNREWGLVHLEMEEAGLPAFAGSEFPNPDFAAFARSCGAQGYTVRTPEELDHGLQQLLETPGPAILDVFIDPDELPVMPHIKMEQIWRFGLAKVRESLIAMRGA